MLITSNLISVRLMAVAQKLTIPLLGIFCLIAVNPAMAKNFGVRVVNDKGQPVSGASVCVGLPGNYKQFGAVFTDADGRAMVDVPHVPITVTVSKTRFSGTRISEPARNFNFMRQVTLSEGVPGPRCRAGSTLASSESSVRVNNVDVFEGVFAKQISPKVTGQPTHYRLSATKDVSNSAWQVFENTIALGDTLSGRDVVYLQLRRYQGNRQGWLEARSKVVPVFLTTYQ